MRLPLLLFPFLSLLANASGQPLTQCPATDAIILPTVSQPTCHTLAAGMRYEGKPYTHGAVWKNGEGFDCTTYLTKVLMDAGYGVDLTVQKMINIATLPAKEIEQAVTENRPVVAGVVWALIASQQGTAIADSDQLQPGDLVQIWYRNAAGLMRGHAAQVAMRLPGGLFLLHGAHGSTASGAVGCKAYDLSPGAMNGPNMTVYSVYGVRPKGNASIEQGSPMSSGHAAAFRSPRWRLERDASEDRRTAGERDLGTSE